jgi:hypothetical protein
VDDKPTPKNQLNRIRDKSRSKMISVVTTSSDVIAMDNYISAFLDPHDIGPVNELVYVLPKNQYMTSNIMSKFEITEHNSIRMLQIVKFNNCFVDVSDLADPLLMAQRELMMQMSPLLLDRKCGHIIIQGIRYECHEIWNPNEMAMAITFPDAML